jgi:hypothetical protein
MLYESDVAFLQLDEKYDNFFSRKYGQVGSCFVHNLICLLLILYCFSVVNNTLGEIGPYCEKLKQESVEYAKK